MACVRSQRSSAQCARDLRTLTSSLTLNYPVEPVVVVENSLRALVIRMGFSILVSSLTDGLQDGKGLALFEFWFALGGRHLAGVRGAAGFVFSCPFEF